MVTAINGVIVLALIAWLVATVIKNLPSRYLPEWISGLVSGRLSWLLPGSSFFAPNPGKYDFFIVFRDRSGELVGEWKGVAVREGHQDVARGLWNPSKSTSKAILDACADLQSACQAFLKETEKEIPPTIQLNASYLAFLKLVTSQSRQFPPEETQFMVLRTDPENKFEPFFISNWHRLA